jgi:alanine racemase
VEYAQKEFLVEALLAMPSGSRNYVRIDLGSLQKNCQAIRHSVGSHTRVLAVVKSDGYGHGMVPSAQALAKIGIDAFGVAEISEAVSLRESGISGDIVVFLGVKTGEFTELIQHGLQPVVFDALQLKELSAFALANSTTVGVHLKVDTGMGRLGVMPSEVEHFVSIIRGEKGIFLAGFMSHFPCADLKELKGTRAQNELFGKIVAEISDPSTPCPAHIANSAAVMRTPDLHWDMVRPGLSLYGCYPSDQCYDMLTLQPVMTFRTEVIQVKDVPAGFGISYGHTHVTSRPSRLALLPVGYNDGYLRSLSNRAQVLVQGRRAPQIGRVCMNVTVIDVTDIPDVCPGDEVILMGRQGKEEITADEIAGWMDTINYEVLCLFGNLNPRVYLKN